MTATTVEIRDARPEEVDAAGETVRAAYQQYEADYPPESWPRFIQMVGELRPRLADGEVIVAVRQGVVVGSVTFYGNAALSGQGEWPEGSAGMVRLGVLPSARGQGIGRLLLEECIERAARAGARSLALHTTEWMAVARAMYERRGFVRDASFDFFPRSGVVGLGYRLGDLRPAHPARGIVENLGDRQ